MFRVMMLATALLAGFQDLYCPACARFSADEWAIDADGLCRGCGREPARVEATSREWSWCEDREEWLDAPCARHPMIGCCAPWSATLLGFVPPGARLGARLFCPQCKATSGFTVGRDDLARCAGCDKPPVTTACVDVDWFWCRKEPGWTLRPCAHDGACLERARTRMPAAWPLPPARLMSFATELPALISTDALAARIDDLDLVVLHVEYGLDAEEGATRPSFDESHIPFARPLPWSALAMVREGVPNEFPPLAAMAEAFRRAGVEADHHVVVYDTGVGQEAARAFVALEYLGMGGRVSMLDGQWKGWVREGRELARGAFAGVEPSAWVPRTRPEIVLDRRQALDVVWSALEPFPTAALVDARPKAEFTGERASKGVRRPGHLPGAVNLPWDVVLRSRADPRFRPEGELRALFESRSVRPGRRVMLYCRSGVEAGIPYVAARALGYDVSLYDGSYADWGNDPDLPVEGGWTVH